MMIFPYLYRRCNVPAGATALQELILGVSFVDFVYERLSSSPLGKTKRINSFTV
jgi:hypothetical protein